MRLVSAEEYVTLPGRTLDWTIHGLLPKPGWVCLVGKPKEGKSFLAWDVACHVAQGRDFLGQKTVQSTVVYLQLDTREPVWRDRLRKLKEDGVAIQGPLLVHPDDQRRLNIFQPPDRQWLREMLEKCDPGLIVVDVVRKLHRADENDATEMTLFSDHLEEVFTGRSVLFVHHLRKIPADVTEPDPVIYARGSSVWLGDVDGYWILHNGKLRITGRTDESTAYKAQRLDNGMWTFPEAYETQRLALTLLAMCEEFPTLSHNQIAPLAKERHKVSRARYYRLLEGRRCGHGGA